MNKAVREIAAEVVESHPEQAPLPRSEAVSVSLPFDVAAQHADLSVPLRRPNRRGPSIDALREEFRAWEAASDEVAPSLDDDISSE